MTNDHLGSPRITTDKDGDVYTRRDFMPFGEEIDVDDTPERTAAVNYASDEIRQKFTTYERDGETELDFAQFRYYSDQLGRFTTQDPLQASGRNNSPQSWNRYSYALNNPMIFIDPEGLDVEFLNDEARGLILDGLPEDIREKVAAAIKDGKLVKDSLKDIKSTDQNFLDLKEIVDDSRTLEITTAKGYQTVDGQKGEFDYKNKQQVRKELVDGFVKSGMTKQEAENLANEVEKYSIEDDEGKIGQFLTEKETGGNARAIISNATGKASTLDRDNQVGTAGHEVYGHALLHFRGQPSGHGDKGAPDKEFYRNIEKRSIANYRGQQKISTPKSVKPKN